MMLEFLQNYWREIIDVAAIILSIVLLCIRKKPVQVVDTVKETILRLLPHCINSSESLPRGQKLSNCLALLSTVLADLGIDFSDDYRRFAAEQVEIILSTPQKKLEVKK